MSPKSADPRHDFSCQLLQKGEAQLYLHQQAKLFACTQQHIWHQAHVRMVYIDFLQE